MALAGVACGRVVLTTFYTLIGICSDGFVPRQDGLAGVPEGISRKDSKTGWA